VRVTAAFSQGVPLADSQETVTIPADKIENGEIVLRVMHDVPTLGLAAQDLLIIEPRAKGHAATGEFIVATLHERAFIGHWWGNHGLRALQDDAFHAIVDAPELTVLGAVTLVARDETR
jgi:hypothetical protein